MRELLETYVLRRGITARRRSLATDRCCLDANSTSQSIDLQFAIASKGGGTIELLVRIGLKDLPTLLKRVAKEFPQMAGVFSECEAMSTKLNLERLRESLKEHEKTKSHARKLVEELKAVAEFLTEKYKEASVGEDEREKELRQKTLNAIETLERVAAISV